MVLVFGGGAECLKLFVFFFRDAKEALWPKARK